MKFLLSLLLISIGMEFSVMATTVSVTGGYHIDSGDNATITAHSTTKKVTNNHASGLTIYIPLNSAIEWSTFAASPPAGVLVENVVSCGGVSVGGHCWYMAAENESCDTKCTGKGGCDLAGISYGNTAQCQTILTALGRSFNGQIAGNSYAFGCNYNSGLDSAVYYTSPAAVCGSSDAFVHRACACNN